MYHRAVRKGAIGLSVALVLAGLALAAMRVVQLERQELDTSGAGTLTATGQEPRVGLVQAELAPGESVLFEVCIDRPTASLEAIAATSPLELVVWRPADEQVVVRTRVDDRLIRQMTSSGDASCATIARGESVAEGGTYAIEAVWLEGVLPPSLAGAAVRGRIVATHALGRIDRIAAGLIAGGGLCLVLVVLLAGIAQRDQLVQPQPQSSHGEWARVAIALGSLLLGMGAIAFVQMWGSTAVLARGLFIAAIEVVCAYVLIAHDGGSRSVALGFDRADGPHRSGIPARPIRFAPLVFALIAPVYGFVLYVLGGRLAGLFPHTGQAPIEAFVSMPSGMLSVATIAVVAPIAEELFFRGLVFSLLERRAGTVIAFVATALLFTVVHVPQVWGAWGGLASVALVGVGLTGLRVVSGSTAACALAHLAYNSALVVSTLS